MDCYLIKKKYRNKNNLDKHYQEAKLLFVFKNYRFKGFPKPQILILEITMLFPNSKLIILTNKNRLIRLIRVNHFTSAIIYKTFSQFNTLLNSRAKDIDVIELKKMKICMKEEEVSTIFEDIIFKKAKVKIDKNNKEINISDLPEYYYDEIKEEKYHSFMWIMKNYEKQFIIDDKDINYI